MLYPVHHTSIVVRHASGLHIDDFVDRPVTEPLQAISPYVLFVKASILPVTFGIIEQHYGGANIFC
jgi:hypothetical protein